MKNARFVLLPLICAVLFSSCAGSAWRQERSAAMASGDRDFTIFVLYNIQEMHDHLTYEEELSDLKRAYRSAAPAEQRLLAKRYNQVKTSQAREEAQAQQRSRAWAAAASNYQAPSSSGYTAPTSNSYSNSQDRIKQMQDQDTINRLRYNQQQLRSNPNTRY